jgi:hypothetical protein
MSGLHFSMKSGAALMRIVSVEEEADQRMFMAQRGGGRRPPTWLIPKVEYPTRFELGVSEAVLRCRAYSHPRTSSPAGRFAGYAGCYSAVDVGAGIAVDFHADGDFGNFRCGPDHQKLL